MLAEPTLDVRERRPSARRGRLRLHRRLRARREHQRRGLAHGPEDLSAPGDRIRHDQGDAAWLRALIHNDRPGAEVSAGREQRVTHRPAPDEPELAPGLARRSFRARCRALLGGGIHQ